MNRLFVFFLMITLVGISLSGQHQMPVQQIKRLFEKADSLYNLTEPTESSDREALQLFSKIIHSQNETVEELRIKSFILTANIHQGYGAYDTANRYYHKAIKSIFKQSGHPDLLYEAYLYLGSSMYFNGIIDSARLYFERASELAMKYGKNVNLPEQDRLYNSLGAIYYEAANYKQAINYFQTALSLAPLGSVQYAELQSSIESNIANCLLKLKNYDSAIGKFKSLNPPEAQALIIRQNLAHAYVEKGVYDSALALYLTIHEPGGLSRVTALNDLGRIYMHLGNLAKAETMFDSAIRINQAITGNLQNKEEALSYLYRSELADKVGLIDESILWANKALKEVHLSFMPQSNYDIPDDITQSVSPITLYQAIYQKANLLYKKYKLEQSQSLLQSSLRCYIKAIETLNYILYSFDNDDARLFFLANSKNLFNNATDVCYEAVMLNESHLTDFAFVLESYKGNILQKKYETNESRKSKLIPETLLDEEDKIKQMYTAYLSKLNQATGEEEANAIKSRLANVQVELSRIQKQIEKFDQHNAPGNLKQSLGGNIAALQHLTDKETGILNFYVNKGHLYLLSITRQQVQLQKIEADHEFQLLLQSFLKDTYQISDGVRYEGYAKGYQLYRHLLGQVEPQLGSLKRMVIIPDEFLFYLPFDALITQPETRAYLVNDYTISYHYSTALLLRQTESKRDETYFRKDSMIAFAPFTKAIADSMGTEVPLPYSQSEIEQKNTRQIINHLATKKNFLKTYDGFRFIHLATHASIQDDSLTSWIKFFPAKHMPDEERLYLHEIYNLNMEGTELVTLSACQTGGGISASGEGLLSLSRAFIYAGAQGIVSTLYKTDDQVTAFLMKRMYYHLESGKEVAAALRQSKLDLLKSTEINSRLKTPNYWANFMYVGKIKKQPLLTAVDFIWWLCIAMLVAAGLYYYFKKLKRT